MKLTSFGELMLRFKPESAKRISQCDRFEASFGGAESNVAVSLTLLGDNAQYVTKLPENTLGDMGIQKLRGIGVDTKNIVRGGDRIGIYFFEKGASVRGTDVVYDRKFSSFSESKADEYDWSKILGDTNYFYVSGITPALSKELQEATLAAANYCNAHGIEVIYDANYRGKLWSVEEAQAFSKQMLPKVSVVLAHDEDFEQAFGIKAFDGDMTNGINQIASFEDAMKELKNQYPNIKTVGTVVRNILSVEKSTWTALLYTDGKFYQGGSYDMHVYEGVAGGDAFGAGLVHGMMNGMDPQAQINFAIAASVYKLTISGDWNLASESEISSIISGGSAMNR
ncbi:2-dehydro-3-deoxygluconokinase [Lentilactobacillus curieae]|uniref:2-dehydro-3-deoxygluconokinase n=1 Tax=Lentilactobacillus curieae TaxID=1138822 RepID=A0A1S6QH11_9LACO|nr:sugar kinase [Lentilactobacillus curieae]AQW20895.1 2-dehydro-3-deoxygluconokinase [Lentilactobacillus curieae]